MIKLIPTAAILSLAIVSAAARETVKPPSEPYADILNSANIPKKLIIRDADQIYWSFFTSSYFGFEEFWVAYSHDQSYWSRALYTAIPVLPGTSYKISVSKEKIDIDWFNPLDTPPEHRYYRSAVDTTVLGYTIYKHVLYGDADADGLSDLAEDVLWTHPYEMDTDGDGKADGYDANPLAAPAEALSLAEKLHKAIIEYELSEFTSNQLVVVEQFTGPMEYERPTGRVLSLSSQGCDAYVEAHGYGVPFLTCTVTETPDRTFAVSFQFFVAPEDAWGYDLIYEWDEVEKAWRQLGPLQKWQAR